LKCFAGCPVEAITAAIGLTVADLFDDAPTHPHRRTWVDARRVDPNADAMRREEDRADVARRLDTARHIWRQARRREWERLDAYLASRGVSRPPTGHVRFHAGVWHRESGRSWPAMVWLITNSITGEPLGCHVTFLDDASVGKAPVEPEKKSFGLVRGGVIRLTPLPSMDGEEPLILAEGVETALSALAAGHGHAWAAVSSGNMKAIDLSDDIRAVIIIADMDDARGMAAARVLAQRLSRQGRNVRIAQPPQGLDLNDVLAGKAVGEVAA
jgi:hypothetical protein